MLKLTRKQLHEAQAFSEQVHKAEAAKDALSGDSCMVVQMRPEFMARSYADDACRALDNVRVPVDAAILRAALQAKIQTAHDGLRDLGIELVG